MSIGVDWFPWDGNGTHPGLQAAIKNDGVSYAYVRASFSTSEDDYDPAAPGLQRADEMLTQIEAAGLVAGAYMMPDYRAGAAPAREQCEAFADAAKLRPGRLPPILDVEFAGGIAATRRGSMQRSRVQLADFISELLAELRRIYPTAHAIAYSSRRVCDDVDVDCLAGAASIAMHDCDWFIARYPVPYHSPVTPALANTLPAPPLPAAAGDADNWWDHQYEGDAIGLRGFAGQVDVNRWNYFTSRSPAGRRRDRVVASLGCALGDFQPLTDLDLEIRTYQRKLGLVADGVIGPATWAWLGWCR